MSPTTRAPRPLAARTALLALVLALVVLMAGLLWLVVSRTTAAADAAGERLRTARAAAVAQQVRGFLDQARGAIAQFEQELRYGILDPHDPDQLEAALLTLLLGTSELTEATFTAAGTARPGQVTVLQQAPAASRPSGELRASRTRVEGRGFTRTTRSLDQPGPAVTEAADDPTGHPTFTTPARSEFRGQTLWSDLHWAEADRHAPPATRRVVVTAQRALDRPGRGFAGVLRVGLRTDALDQIVARAAGPGDPHLVFLCDREGRLVTRRAPDDPVAELDDVLRMRPGTLPTALRKALAHDPAVGSARDTADGEAWLTTFAALPDTQDWRVGVVVPEAHYLGAVWRARDQLLLGTTAIALLLLVGSGWFLRHLHRDLAHLTREALALTAFDFSARDRPARFAEVGTVLSQLELSKTALRAMGRYVPLELVRTLVRARAEPTLGGEHREITLMFTDLMDFTTLAEALPPDQLAHQLGLYLAAMTRAIHQTGGVVDKYIGDAVMALWNAPEPLPDHAQAACAAALRCQRAAQELFASPAWGGQPPLTTRFGIHTGRVLVGHFGAPDRMSYTALGDGVNLAARLEPLNKQLGTTVLVSAAVERAARARFSFRPLGEVQVKGRLQGVTVFELLGERPVA